MDGLALAIVALAAMLVALHIERCRRFLFRREDPRTMGLFRVACGLCTVGWTVELWPLLDYLFSDEGLFATDVARQVFAARTFAGFGDGSVASEPTGFFDLAAVLHFVGSPTQSILFFWDTPTAVRAHAGALTLAATLLTLGLGTRWAKWATLLLFHSLVARNAVFLAGEQVFANFLLFLCLSRCGEAYSVDALRRGRSAPGSATVPWIPAWPRALALLQMIPMFTANGLHKFGQAWAEGDTFHYLLLHPHFHRFDPTAVAMLFSENLFRVMTWAAHAFELLFPLAIVGVVLRFTRRSRIAPLTGARAVCARGAWLGIAIATAVCASLAYQDEQRETLPFVTLVAASVAVGMLALVSPWLRSVKIRGRVLDLDWVARWPLGRRVWVTLLVLFSGTLVTLTSLGWFVPLTLATAILFFDGAEIDGVLRRLRGRRPLERPEHDDAGVRPALSDRALFVGVLAIFATALVAAMTAAVMWSIGLVAIGAGLALSASRAFGADDAVHKRRRFIVGWFCSFHVAAVTLVLLPSGDPVSSTRTTVEAPLRRWLDHAHAMQYWRMFAPSAPRMVASLDVEVTLPGGTSRTIGTGIPTDADSLFRLGRDKAEKISRRIAGSEGAQWYAKWHGRYICRNWALEHGGAAPADVALFVDLRPTAPPRVYASGDLEAIRSHVESGRRRELVWQASCANEVHGQLSPELAARHRVPIDEGFRPWPKPRAHAWYELRAHGEVPDFPWPFAVLGIPTLVVLTRRERRSAAN